MKILAPLLSLLVLAHLHAAEPAAIELFNGRSLEGWVQKGGAATFAARDGEIVGITAPNTPNSFLCTERQFANFVLELEFKVDPHLNSGVQIRSLVGDTEVTETWLGRPVKIRPGTVHGLQVEIDPSGRAWTGGIHAEGGGGWLFDLKNNEPARKAFKQGEWNQLRIEARGDSIRTWVNGVPAADLRNDVNPKGFIALQVHTVGKSEEKLEVHFRNLRVQELP